MCSLCTHYPLAPAVTAFGFARGFQLGQAATPTHLRATLFLRFPQRIRLPFQLLSTHTVLTHSPQLPLNLYQGSSCTTILFLGSVKNYSSLPTPGPPLCPWVPRITARIYSATFPFIYLTCGTPLQVLGLPVSHLQQFTAHHRN